jgi:prepilin-type N-terminal cleavage/methylation domain-containing protein
LLLNDTYFLAACCLTVEEVDNLALPSHRRGFSLLELLIVVTLASIVAAVAMPRMLQAINTIKIRGSAETVATLLQKARMQAARDNKFYTVIPATSLGLVRDACVDLNWNQTCGNGDYVIELASNVAFTNAVPSTAVITCGPLTTPCPPGYTGLNFNPEPAATVLPSFNARGLPCVNSGGASTEPTWPTSRCVNNDPNPPFNGAPVGFLYSLVLNSSLGTKYSAVVVTPAGRILVYTYEGQDGNGVDVWAR